jgi:hypothetical protein
VAAFFRLLREQQANNRKQKHMKTPSPRPPFALTLAASVALVASSANAALPQVYRATTTVYATVSGPLEMDFAADGTMYVGNGASGSPKIWRIGPGGSPAEPLGRTGIPDPDAVVVDRTGAISGIAGAVLVGGGQPGFIKAINPDGWVFDFLSSLSGLSNPAGFTFDRSGRLLLLDLDSGNWGIVSADSVTALGSVGRWGGSIIVDASGRVMISCSQDARLRVFAVTGSFLEYLDIGSKPQSPLATASSPFWGTNIYAVDPTGQLLSVDLAGQLKVKGRGFQDAGDMLFGSDGSLYLSEYGNDRILKITPDGGPTLTVQCSTVDVCWNSLTNYTYQVQYRSDLTTNQWVNLGQPIPGTGWHELHQRTRAR